MPKIVRKKRSILPAKSKNRESYNDILTGLVALLETSRRASVRSVNAIMTATYWEIGRRIVEYEQSGFARAEYGEELLKRLANDLSGKFGRGFGAVNLAQMRRFYTVWPDPSGQSEIFQTLSEKSENFDLSSVAAYFPLSWSHYVRLLSIKDENTRAFYETEALRGGWSVRQLDRQISSRFYDRLLTARDKASFLKRRLQPHAEDVVTTEEAVKDPFILEFLGLRDEYSENHIESALIKHLETFLLELGGDFTFVARQKRLRVGHEWFRVDLVFYHRGLRCLVLIDLKLGKFTHADVGQMLLYTNYAKANWTRSDENPPIGLILCEEKNEAIAHWTLEGLPSKIAVAEYRKELPDEKLLENEIAKTRRLLIANKTKVKKDNPATFPANSGKSKSNS